MSQNNEQDFEPIKLDVKATLALGKLMYWLGINVNWLWPKQAWSDREPFLRTSPRYRRMGKPPED